MRDLYIVAKGLHLQHGAKFSNFHAITIGDGTEDLVSVLFHSDAMRDVWEAIPGVQVIGNEYDPSPISPAVTLKLAEFGVALTDNHTAKSVRKIVRAKTGHPLI